jgi:hypothetical protein
MDASVFERAGARLQARWGWLAAVGVLLLAWGLAGFLLVPRLARNAITDYVQHDMGRRVSIGRIGFNPFTLTAEIRDFELAEPGGAPIASFALLRVDASGFSSLLHRAWVLQELRLEKPVVYTRLDEQGSLNLARLAPRQRPRAQPGPAGALPALRIGTLSVANGRIAYEDRTRATPFNVTLTPIEFTLNDFRTAPSYENAYRFEAATLAGEKLAWTGQFTLQPLSSSGHFSVGGLKAATIAAYLQDTLPFALPSGQLDLAGDYRLRLGGAVGLEVELPRVAVRDLAIAPKGAADATPWITLPAVEVGGTTLALAQRRVHIERVGIANAAVTAWRERDGTLNLARLAAPGAVADAAAPAPAPASAAAAPAAAAWDVSVATIELRSATLDFEDRGIEPAGRMKLTPLDAIIAGYSLQPGTPLTLDASVGFDGHGRLAARGAVTPAPLAADLELQLADFALLPLQPWVAAATALRLEGGSVNARGRLRLQPAPKRGEPGLEFRGNVGVAKLLTRDAALKQELVGWQQLDLQGIELRRSPDSLRVDTVRARKPYGRVVIGADRTFNIARVLAGPAGAASPAVAAAAPKAGPEAAPKAARMPMRIRRVLIEDGTADFADYSVQPNFAAGILGLNGSVTGLSSDPDSRAEVKLVGSVDRYAPVDISGQVNLLAADVYTDVAMNFRNMELTTFNPYSGKFAGYSIAKGKLTTELRYHVERRQLDAQHHITLDQLEFGAATESKDAVPLPVKLAVALLKDRNGVIDIDLPITGSLDDPKFRIGPIVWKAVMGLLRKIVTAPFALLGALFGGGPDLQYVQFAAGSAALAPAETDKLGKLTKALVERPQLKLDIPLQTLTRADDVALANAAFEAAVTAATPATSAKQKSPPRLIALTALYTQAFGAKPVYPASTTTAAPTPTAEGTASAPAAVDPTAQQITWLESQLQPKYVATVDQRAALAQARADAVQAAVLGDGQVAPERVFLAERASGKGGPADSARMELKLE